MLRETIRTERLILRPHTARDAEAVTAGIGNFAVARNLSTPPWPYEMRHAEQWIEARPAERAEGRVAAYAICTPADQLIGTITLSRMQRYEDVAPGAWELGYWLGEPHWGFGFATEAGRALIDAADADLGSQTIVAAYFMENAQSRHALEKLGFHKAGVIRTHFANARGCDVDVQPMLRPATPPDGSPLP
jgi:RimJ/RimL family protein N-acetyltransferase